MPNHYDNSFPTDKASLRYYSYYELFLSKLKIFKFFKKISAGKAVIISKNVEIKITDNGKLKLGDHTVIAKDASIILTKPNPLIDISENVLIGNGSLILGKKKIVIGKNTRIGAYTTIRDHMHKDVSSKNTVLKSRSTIKDVLIGKNVWIGNYCTIFPGVKIGDNSTISTYSLVMNNIPPNTLVAGQPARFIRKI